MTSKSGPWCIGSGLRFTLYYIQISCSSTSTELTDQNRFRHHFQLAQTMVDISGIYKGLINHYQWEYVSLITQNENLFTVVSIAN